MWKELLVVVAFLWAAALGVALLANVASEVTCRESWNQSGYPSRYQGLFGGCQVLVNGGWVPQESVKFVKRAQ